MSQQFTRTNSGSQPTSKKRLSMQFEGQAPNYWEDTFTILNANVHSTKQRKDKGEF